MMQNYNHESKENLAIQGKILMTLTEPMDLKTLIKKMRIDYRTRKNDVLRNSNYLLMYKKAIVSRRGVLYLEEDDPGRYVRQYGGQEE